MPHPHYPHLFSPFQLKHVTLRNRVAISGHHAGWWVDKGVPSDDFAAYIEERCRDNGVGLFVIGCTSPKPGSGWLENLDDSVIPAYRKCVDAAQRHGSALIAQLCHPGWPHLPGVPLTDNSISAPPTQPGYRGTNRRHVPSIDELKDLVASFGAAAARAAEAGVDGLELHNHEWFLHSQMLNPMWNTRTDAYGGPLENRMRFMVETLRAMRAAIGPKLILGIRLKGDDMEQRGMDAGEYQKCIKRLEDEKLVDYVLLTGGDARLHHGPMPRPEGEWLDLVRQHRQNTKLPLLHAGRITTADMAERALAENIVDLVCMTKTHIADAHFTRKVFENRPEDIRQCTRCLQGCHHAMHRMTCVYNPLTSRELTWGGELPRAERKRRVVVIGAGPAGMEAALTAALRGHDVTVLEKGDRVGGQVWTGAGSPMRKPWARIAEFYERQSRKGLFDVVLKTEATVEAVRALRPDVVVVATGSSPLRAEIPGGRACLTVHEVIAGRADNAKHAIVLDRETSNRPWVAADYLSSRGTKVTFVTPFLKIGPDIEHWTLDEYLRQLKSRGVTFHPGTDVAEWNGDSSAVLRDVQTAAESRLADVDCVVGLVGSRAVDGLAHPLRALGVEMHVIGDANSPKTVEAATFQGARIGRLL